MNPFVLIVFLVLLISIFAVILYAFDYRAVKPTRDAEKEFYDRDWKGKL